MSAADSLEVRAPDEQSEGTRSQLLLLWLKQVGDAVSEHEPLIEIETDKVTVEVAAPGSGVLTEILKQEQEEITPGELLGRIEPRAAPVRAVTGAAGRRHEGGARAGARSAAAVQRSRRRAKLSPAVRQAAGRARS